jgi:hypothetical protein
MTSRCTQVLATAVILAAAFASTGCDSNTATSGTAGLSVRYNPSPSGAGRFEGGTNDFANMIIFKITFEPVDPELVPLLGGEALSMRFSDYNANLASAEPLEYAAIAVPPGTYRITELTFRPPQLQDGEATAAAPVCIERIASIPSGPAASQVPVQMTLDANDGYVFSVSPNQTKLDIRVDVPALLAAYQAAFTCQDSCGGGNACLTAFDEAAFRAAFLAHVTIQ